MGATCFKPSDLSSENGKNILTVMKKEVSRSGLITINMNVICNMKCFLVMCTDRNNNMDYLRLSNGIVSWGSHPQQPVEFAKSLDLEIDNSANDVIPPTDSDHCCYLFSMPQLYEHRNHLKVFSEGANVSIACAVLPEKIARYIIKTTPDKKENVFSIRTCQITPTIKNRECGVFFTKLEGDDTTIDYVYLVRSAIVVNGKGKENRVLVNKSRQVLTRIDSPDDDLRGWFLEDHKSESDADVGEDLHRFLESGDFAGTDSVICENPALICDNKEGLFMSAESLESNEKRELELISELNRGFEWTTLSKDQGTPFKHADIVNMHIVDIKTDKLKPLCEMTCQGGDNIDDLAKWLLNFK